MSTLQMIHLSNSLCVYDNKKSEGFPYSLPSLGPGADPDVQAVSPQMTISHLPGGRLPLLLPCLRLPS